MSTPTRIMPSSRPAACTYEHWQQASLASPEVQAAMHEYPNRSLLSNHQLMLAELLDVYRAAVLQIQQHMQHHPSITLAGLQHLLLDCQVSSESQSQLGFKAVQTGRRIFCIDARQSAASLSFVRLSPHTRHAVTPLSPSLDMLYCCRCCCLPYITWCTMFSKTTSAEAACCNYCMSRLVAPQLHSWLSSCACMHYPSTKSNCLGYPGLG